MCDFLLVIISNHDRIFHRFPDMASFLLKTHIFPTPPLFNPKFKNVPFAFDTCNWHFACPSLPHM